jgi:hypothetical protein
MIDTTENYKRLVLAVVLLAIQDAANGDTDAASAEARQWLLTEGKRLLLLAGIEVTGEDVNRVLDGKRWGALRREALTRSRAWANV